MMSSVDVCLNFFNKQIMTNFLQCTLAMTSEQIDDERKNKLIGEAKFLRATLYFALVTTWEHIPLIDS